MKLEDMLAYLPFNIFGVIVFLYLFWKRLKEDYPANQIFSTAFYMLLGALFISLLAKRTIPEWWFWTNLSGLFLGLLLGIVRYKLRIFETIEAAAISLLPWFGLYFLGDSVKTAQISSFIGFLIISGLVSLFFVFDAHYKNFTWYKSGRIGFSGLTTLGLFFLLRATFASFFPDVVSFVGKYDALISAVVSFASFLAVFNLARKET